MEEITYDILYELGYRIMFENNRLAAFEMPYLDTTGRTPKWKFDRIEVAMTSSGLKMDKFDKDTSEEEDFTLDEIEGTFEYVKNKGWTEDSSNAS